MLHVRVLAPRRACDDAIAAIRADPTTANLAVVRGAALDGAGDLLLFDVARENANAVVEMLRGLGLAESGSISLSDPVTVLSSAADAAEAAAPGHPSDGVVWDEVENTARGDARLSWSFLVFLVLATLIAGVGRYLDQPILIIGAMVVGPEFAPLAAICIGLARRRRGLIAPASLTLFGGFLAAALIAWVAWALAYAFGVIDFTAATTGTATEFIIKPDAWSFVIALLAGCAGVLSLTSAKSSALVGVFISITTVPAVGTIGLTLAVGSWDEAGASAIQLAINLAGLIIAGTLTLLVQGLVSPRHRISRPGKTLRGRPRRSRSR
ncbi:MAG: DUF389 domain-containing protein [Micrococcales bacterium]|nr:DUF389 domain-containing protein [Micrococcales bacterium]OJX69400.1 MAG: DUF389 domain-containing protein [Micrococcales bacterium 72-143]